MGIPNFLNPWFGFKHFKVFSASLRVSMVFRCDFWEMREPSLVLHTSRNTNLHNAYRSITEVFLFKIYVLHLLFDYSTLPGSNSTSNSSSNFSCSFLITLFFSFSSQITHTLSRFRHRNYLNHL